MKEIDFRSTEGSGKRVLRLLVFLVIASITCVALFLSQISRPRIVGRAVAPDGTEMCVVQQCNWNAEPFTTSFVYRKPGTSWRRFWYDHQDTYWGSSRAAINTNTGVAVFYRDTAPAVTFSWASETYTLHRRSRTLTGPQWELPVDWDPHKPVPVH